MQMAGTKLVRLRIGSQEYLKPLYVAPIENDMLLGLDFLLKYHARVNWKPSSPYRGWKSTINPSGNRVIKGIKNYHQQKIGGSPSFRY